MPCAAPWRRSIATAASPSRFPPVQRPGFAVNARISRRWPATSRVFIEVLVEQPAKPGATPMLRIIVDDDGRGLSEKERAQVSRRGQRLDESKPGSGLGLSIVVDLAALYGGSLTLGHAPTGGLRAELLLPAA